MLIMIPSNNITPEEIGQYIGNVDLSRQVIAELLGKEIETIDQWVSGELEPNEPILLRFTLERLVELYGIHKKETNKKLKEMLSRSEASLKTAQAESRAWREKLAQV